MLWKHKPKKRGQAVVRQNKQDKLCRGHRNYKGIVIKQYKPIKTRQDMHMTQPYS